MRKIFEDTYRRVVNRENDRFIDKRYIAELNSMKGEKYQARTLPEKLKKEYQDYYASVGFDNVPLNWVEYVYSVKNEFDVGYIPDPLYHKFIDPYFPFAKYEIADKFLQPFVLQDITDYPETIITNVGGTFFDSEQNILEIDEALKLLGNYNEFIVKPTVYNGAGLNVMLLKNTDSIKSLFLEKYKKDFIVQKKLEQSPYMAQFNESSVNTVRIFTMFRNGKVRMLSSYFRMGHPGSCVDNLTGHLDSYRVHVNEDGQLDPVAYNICSEPKNRTWKGKLLSECRIEQFREMVEIAKKGQRRLAKHKFIAWDFAVDKNGKIVVIEYNFKLHPIIDYEITEGPIFGDDLDDILREAAQYRTIRDMYGVTLENV